MRLNLVGKFNDNPWGAEHFVKESLRELGHEVMRLDISETYGILRRIEHGALTVVMQGYGMHPKLIQAVKRLTGKPVVLWHAEVMSPEWPTEDEVVKNKAYHLSQNAAAYDAIGHNCHCCLSTIEQLGGKQVFWAPANGVDAKRHRPIKIIPKLFDVGFYGHPSPRRVKIIEWLKRQGIHVEWRLPQDGFFGDDLTNFINECHSILNLHYSETPNTECRIYEALGCGVPVVTEPISMPDLFPSPRYYFFRGESPEELLKHLQFITNDSPARYLEAIGQKMSGYIHEDASYRNRCENFLKTIGELFPC